MCICIYIGSSMISALYTLLYIYTHGTEEGEGRVYIYIYNLYIGIYCPPPPSTISIYSTLVRGGYDMLYMLYILFITPAWSGFTQDQESVEWSGVELEYIYIYILLYVRML